jgi:hypothetical protein
MMWHMFSKCAAEGRMVSGLRHLRSRCAGGSSDLRLVGMVWAWCRAGAILVVCGDGLFRRWYLKLVGLRKVDPFQGE